MFAFHTGVLKNLKSPDTIADEIIGARDLGLQGFDGIINEIAKRRESMAQFGDDKRYTQEENLRLGIYQNEDEPGHDDNYLQKAALCWPTRGYSQPFECWVRVKCRTDRMFLKHDQRSADLINRAVKKLGEKMVDKCFWPDPEGNPDMVCKLLDRVRPDATTYNAVDTMSEQGWRNIYYINEESVR